MNPAAPDPSAWLAAIQGGEATLAQAAEAAQRCRACELWKRATQTVFGCGQSRASLMLIGEQPGDQEDHTGLPFVGPAGRLLDKALRESGIDRAGAYVTNIVKHFNWEERGKWRIHKKPKAHHVEACRPWLEAEIAALKPQVVVCLGATAAQALLGRSFRVTEQRGTFVPSPFAPYVLATVHPSSLLRAPDDATRHAETKRFIADLKKVSAILNRRTRNR